MAKGNSYLDDPVLLSDQGWSVLETRVTTDQMVVVHDGFWNVVIFKEYNRMFNLFLDRQIM